MNKVSELVFEQVIDTTVLVNSGFKTYMVTIISIPLVVGVMAVEK